MTRHRIQAILIVAVAATLGGCSTSAARTSGTASPLTGSASEAIGSIVPSGSSAPSDAAPTAAAIGLAADDGARVIGVQVRDVRTRDLTIDSPAVGIQKARLILPIDYHDGAAASWPVLMFLHTANNTEPYPKDSYDTRAPEPKRFEGLSDLDAVLVVVPEGGAWGWYSDWWNGGLGGPPMWETFQLVELRQLIERNWQAGDRRAVIGASMGGYGAIEYATRHPELFVGAASISGPLDIMGQDYPDMDRAWGDPEAHADIWLDHNPIAHADRLKGTTMALFVSYGDGRPAPPDDLSGPVDDTEADIAKRDAAFVDRLHALHVPVTVSAFGRGHHLQFFDREFDRAVKLMVAALRATA
jgi:diacylglycerol O-acyltransferase/trehalose O-mycolyltransferase